MPKQNITPELKPDVEPNMTEDELKEKAKELYDDIIEYYNYIEQNASRNLDISYEETDEIFDTLLSEPMKTMYQGIEEIVQGIEFYKMIYDRTKMVKTYEELIELIKFYHFDNSDSPFLASKYNIVGHCMKIITHLQWRLCYDLAPRLRETPEEAIRDILYPTEASQKEMIKIIHHLETKLGKKILN